MLLATSRLVSHFEQHSGYWCVSLWIPASSPESCKDRYTIAVMIEDKLQQLSPTFSSGMVYAACNWQCTRGSVLYCQNNSQLQNHSMLMRDTSNLLLSRQISCYSCVSNWCLLYCYRNIIAIVPSAAPNVSNKSMNEWINKWNELYVVGNMDWHQQLITAQSSSSLHRHTSGWWPRKWLMRSLIASHRVALLCCTFHRRARDLSIMDDRLVII